MHQISTLRIPNPFKFTDHNSAEFKQEKERAKKWLVSLKRGFTVDTFHFTKNKIICEEHFEPQMFEEDVRAKLLGCTPSRKTETRCYTHTVSLPTKRTNKKIFKPAEV